MNKTRIIVINSVIITTFQDTLKVHKIKHSKEAASDLGFHWVPKILIFKEASRKVYHCAFTKVKPC